MATREQLARREGAAQRRQSHAERSVVDQLELIAQRPGQSRKEVARLTGGEFQNAADALAALQVG